MCQIICCKLQLTRLRHCLNEKVTDCSSSTATWERVPPVNCLLNYIYRQSVVCALLRPGFERYTRVLVKLQEYCIRLLISQGDGRSGSALQIFAT